MNTTEIIALSLAALAGVLIGGIFFAGLWWTLQYGLKSKRPALLFMASLLVRFGLALTGFYFVGGGHLERLVACLAGFMVSRLVTARFMRRDQSLSKPRSADTPPGSQIVPQLQDSITPLDRIRGQPVRRSPRSMVPAAQGRPRKRGALHDKAVGEGGRTTAIRQTQKG